MWCFGKDFLAPPRLVFCLSACAACWFGAPLDSACGQSIVWERRPVFGPIPRFLQSITFDSLRNVNVLYGGVVGGNETWEFNGTQWSLKATSGPQNVSGLAMAFHAVSGTTVLFGGRIGNQLTDQTWEWDGTTWTRRWSTGPVARHGHAMVYDALRSVVVLFGGQTDLGSTYSGETWIWDGDNWLLAASAGPSPRFLHAMAYDSSRHVTVLFGGNVGTNLGDTWEWNGSTWVRRVTSGPAARYGHAMSFDVGRNCTVLFGGDVGGAETWQWNGSSWTEQILVGPSSRLLHSMAFDTGRNVSVMFGGWGSTGMSGETWELCTTPAISEEPLSQFSCLTGQVSFTVEASGSGPLAYQWRHGDPLQDIAGATQATLTITSVTEADGGLYECVVTNSCGSAITNLVTLSICAADFNCDGEVDFFDYLDFVSLFSTADPRADFNHDGIIDFFDYLDFVDLFSAGC